MRSGDFREKNVFRRKKNQILPLRPRNTQPHLKSFWDLTEVSEQSWYKVLTYELVNPTFKKSAYCWNKLGGL